MKYHIHDWSDWQDVGAVETWLGNGSAILQSRKCVICGKRQLQRTTAVTQFGFNYNETAHTQNLINGLLNIGGRK